jgi:hypothetical protein
MGLCPLRKGNILPTFASLDQHIMQMHCSSLREILDAVVCFTERVTPSIAQTPSAVMWPIIGPLLITRSRWLLFCRRVLALLRLLGLATEGPASPTSLPWPDADHLICAAARAYAACSQFSAPRRRHSAIGRATAAAAALRE